MAKQIELLKEHHGYHAGHPWYYLLGGIVPTPKQIRAAASASNYRGYMAHNLYEIDKQPEPKRYGNLRKWRNKFKEDLKSDLSRYRVVVRELHKTRETQDWNVIPSCCDDVHTAMSLKHAHLYNDFAHLHFIDELLSKGGKQLDLFEL